MARSQSALLLSLVLGLAVHGMAWAGFDEALKAYQGKDYPAALREARSPAGAADPRASFLLGVMHQAGHGVAADPAQAVVHYEKAAVGGVVGAYSKLAQAYARGAGVARDRDKALAYARRSAQIGDPEGALFLSVILTAEYLGYVDASGKADDKKYMQLAGRALSERGIDTEARDALYWAADKGHPLAIMTLGLTLGGSVGDGNRKRMQALIDKLPTNSYPALLNYGKLSGHMDTLGDTYTSPQLFFDAQTQQMLAAMLQTCGLRDSKEVSKFPPPKLIATAVTKPLSNAIFLPSKVAGYERTYLIAGQWEEGWTYTGCDKTAVVTVKFSADGLGGARMISEQTMKRN
jgi:hypothetical protein